MNERRLDAGTRLFFGVPANPMSEIIVDAIGQVVAQVPGIREAYLPQCFVQGDSEAHQVLVVGIDTPEKIPGIMEDLMAKMKLVLPQNQFIDILPFASSAMPPEARLEECKIYEAKHKPWWKLW